MLGMVVVLLVQPEISCFRKRQQAFCCFNVLHFGMKHLPLQLNVLQHRRAKHKDQQDQSEHGDVGQCETDANVAWAKHYWSPERITNPTPRTVWRSLRGRSPSTLRRSLVICTSITLSSGV